MKNSIVAFCLLLISYPAAAQVTGDSLIVNLKNGQRVAVSLQDLDKITFDLPPAAVNAPEMATGHSNPVAFPNPVHSSTTIAFELPTSGKADVLVFDAKGNLIRSLEILNAQAGKNQIVWDGLSDRGAQIPNGDYFYEVRFKGETQTRKMVVIK